MPQLGLMNHVTSAHSPVWANDYSLDFGGTDEIGLLGTTITAADDFSVSFWFKTSDLTGQFFFGHSSTDSLAILSATSMRFVIGSESETFTSLDTMLANTWTHIVVTREAGGSNTVTVYINGVAQTDTKTNAQTFSISFIGARTLSALFYIGYIDEFAIWDKELAATAVLAVYNNGTPIDLLYDSGRYGRSGDLQHYWRMGDGVLDAFPLIADQTNASLGSELNTASNAASITNETDATTGWSNVNCSTFESQSTIKHTGSSYALKMDETDDPTNGARVYIDLDASPYSLTNKVIYKLSLFARHLGSGGDWVIQMGSSGSGSQGGVLTTLTSSDTTFTEITHYWIHGDNYQYLNIQENSGDNDGGCYVDQISIKAVGIASLLMTNMEATDIKEDVPPS